MNQLLSIAPARDALRTGVLLRRTHEMIRAGRILAARAMLNALARVGATAAELAEVEAMLLLREGRAAAALPVLDGAIAACPERGALYLCRSDARMQCGDAGGAAADAAEAVLLDPGCHAAKAMLGVALIDLGAWQDAVTCLADACRQAPLHAAYRQGLAVALERGGRPAEAAAGIADFLAREPGCLALHISGIMLAMRQRDFTRAAALAEAARGLGVADACVFGLLGHALSSLGRHEEAPLAYAEALKLAPEDRYVRHLVAAGGIGATADRAPAEYLQAVFDGYADRFEESLIGLGYRVPGLLRAEVLRLGAPAGPVLDLGCGTGLVAVALSDLALGPWVGVDLSAGMLAQARGKGLYHALVQADLLEMLRHDDRQWGLILAADVMCYFGALEPVLALIAATLAPGGTAMFSTEENQDAGDWRLGRLGRFAHGADYVGRAVEAAGLTLRQMRREVLRQEAGGPVPGLLVTVERAP